MKIKTLKFQILYVCVSVFLCVLNTFRDWFRLVLRPNTLFWVPNRSHEPEKRKMDQCQEFKFQWFSKFTRFGDIDISSLPSVLTRTAWLVWFSELFLSASIKFQTRYSSVGTKMENHPRFFSKKLRENWYFHNVAWKRPSAVGKTVANWGKVCCCFWLQSLYCLSGLWSCGSDDFSP